MHRLWPKPETVVPGTISPAENQHAQIPLKYLSTFLSMSWETLQQIGWHYFLATQSELGFGKRRKLRSI